jgi:hypothetical protein
MSNTDLQQFNGTQEFPATADVGTNADTYLIPTDGKLITADSNLTNQAPANPSKQRIKNLYLGLRAATIGDFMGAIRKTFKSLHVDGTGGATSAIPAGEIEAASNITSTGGNVEATVGDLLAPGGSCTVDQNVTAGAAVISDGGLVISGNAAGEHTELTEARLEFLDTGTGSGDANPPQGTAIPNQQRAINIPKCSAFINMAMAGTIGSFAGHGIASAAINGGDSTRIDITFTTAFDDTNFTFLTGPTRAGAAAILAMPFERLDLRTTTGTSVQVWNTVAGAPVDFNATAINFSVHFNGKQTT